MPDDRSPSPAPEPAPAGEEVRRSPEAALRETEQRFAVMFRRSPLAKTWVRLPEGTFEDVNDAWVELTGIRREEAIGRTAAELGLLPEAERQRFYGQLMGTGVAEGETTLQTRRHGPRRIFTRAEQV